MVPVSRYFRGRGEEVLTSMEKEYGAEEGKKIFYATATKRGMKPKGGKRGRKKK